MNRSERREMRREFLKKQNRGKSMQEVIFAMEDDKPYTLMNDKGVKVARGRIMPGKWWKAAFNLLTKEA